MKILSFEHLQAFSPSTISVSKFILSTAPVSKYERKISFACWRKGNKYKVQRVEAVYHWLTGIEQFSSVLICVKDDK